MWKNGIARNKHVKVPDIDSFRIGRQSAGDLHSCMYACIKFRYIDNELIIIAWACLEVRLLTLGKVVSEVR